MGFNVVGIGEVLWDLLPEGRQLGGAPANFAYHAQSLGANATVITRVGKDAAGAAIQCRFREIGLSLAGLQQDEIAPTGTVSVALGKNGVPSYIIQENVAWDYISATRSALECVGTADVVCFGSLAQRHPTSRQSIQTLVSSAPNRSWRVFDVNLRQNFYTKQLVERSLGLANVLKLNDQELPVLAAMFELSGDTREQILELAVRFDLRVVALTCGPNGSLLCRDGHFAEGNPSPIQVKDTVGAGDAFTAALCMGLLTDLELDRISTIANRIAAHVCGCTGATPPLPADLRQLLPPEPNHPLALTPAPNPVRS